MRRTQSHNPTFVVTHPGPRRKHQHERRTQSHPPVVHLKVSRNDILNHDYYTDIISFALSEIKGQLVGDVYISVDRVKENAKTMKNTQVNELLRVIFHGALHFCGYKDKKSADAKLMRSMEEKWLKAYLKSVPRGTI